MEDQPRKPAPPSLPPAPPPADLLRPTANPIPLTPMMDFLQRRLETLERDLQAERERARTAQQLITQQDSMRAEVEANLKTLHEQMRREKTERESEEMRSHARGRIDALERRLDEMHQSWAELLKEAISKRDSTAQEATAAQESLKAELARVSEAVATLTSELPQMRAMVGQVPAEERKGFAQVAERLSGIAEELGQRLGAWERRQSAEAERIESKAVDLARERAALQEAWAERDSAMRQELVKERVLRERELAETIAGIKAAVEGLSADQQKLAAGAADVKGAVGQVMAAINTPPKAKDAMIVELEREKVELLRALRERGETLEKFAAARQELERTLGDSLQAAHAQLDAEREAGRQALRRAAELEGRLKAIEDRLADAARAAQAQDERYASLSAERDALTRALVQEAEKTRTLIDERAASDEAWTAKLAELHAKLEHALSAESRQKVTSVELQSQLSTLSAQLAKALQEKEAVAARKDTWDHERQALMTRLKEKEDMIAMLSSSFQQMLKK